MEGSEDKKPDHINVKVQGADGSEIFFKIKKSTPLKKLMDAYCEKQGKQASSMRFLFDGKPINGMETAEKLNLENEDVIEARLEQTGGSL